jgi:hypothetical protein
MFQAVVVAVCGVASVLMGVYPFLFLSLFSFFLPAPGLDALRR